MKERIIEFLNQNGITEVGFCTLDKEKNPFGLGYAISYVVPLSKAVVEGITDEPTHTYFHHYRTVNTFIDNTSLKIGMMLAGVVGQRQRQGQGQTAVLQLVLARPPRAAGPVQPSP